MLAFGLAVGVEAVAGGSAHEGLKPRLPAAKLSGAVEPCLGGCLPVLQCNNGLVPTLPQQEQEEQEGRQACNASDRMQSAPPCE